MVTLFSDGQTLHGKEAEKFSLFDEAFKLVLQAYANGAFRRVNLKMSCIAPLHFYAIFKIRKRLSGNN